ncbi:MAG: sugar phosphate isomerase/epimerase [Pirellulaceae bacterium]|nr:sugar phosphate isomerase/epimerase [Pirellulaceae bacterium]
MFDIEDQPQSPKLTRLSRRSLVGWPLFAAASAGAGALLSQASAGSPTGQSPTAAPRLRYCLNTSTINGGVIPVRQQLKIAADAGYDAVELWTRDIEKHVAEGGSLTDLRKELNDLELGLDSAIAFGKWIVDDEAERGAGLEQCRRDMELVRELGGSRIAAPPVGVTGPPKLDLDAAAQRYHALLEVGRQCDVVPQLELWGFSHNLSTLAEVLYVAAAANHSDACLLLDVYHLYKGGNDFRNVGLIPASQMHCLHINDYPGTPERAKIADKDRVYPGDGVAPLGNILKRLFDSGFSGTLSLELFNRNYWQQPPDQVARIGLEKTKQAVQAAG